MIISLLFLMRRVTGVIVIFHFRLFLALLQSQKIKISKTWKKHLETSLFYTIALKIMIICYTVPEIWRVTDVIVIFHFGHFCALLPSNSQKKWKFQKMKKYWDIIIHSCFISSVWRSERDSWIMEAKRQSPLQLKFLKEDAIINTQKSHRKYFYKAVFHIDMYPMCMCTRLLVHVPGSNASLCNK